MTATLIVSVLSVLAGWVVFQVRSSADADAARAHELRMASIELQRLEVAATAKQIETAAEAGLRRAEAEKTVAAIQLKELETATGGRFGSGPGDEAFKAVYLSRHANNL